MNKRSFLKTLFGASIAAPAIAKALASESVAPILAAPIQDDVQYWAEKPYISRRVILDKMGLGDYGNGGYVTIQAGTGSSCGTGGNVTITGGTPRRSYEA